MAAEPGIVWLQRYGLTCPPYELSELDPISRPQDTARTSTVGGFELLDGEAWAAWERRTAVEDGPCAVVVRGADGTGRTSFANHVLARYRSLRGYAPERFLSVSVPAPDYDEMRLLREIANVLHRKAQHMPFVTARATAALRGLEAVGTADELYVRARLGEHLDRLAQDLGKDGGFGVVVERSRTIGIVQAVLATFRSTRALVVLTVDDRDDIRADLARYAREVGNRVSVVALRHLGETETVNLVVHRWNHAPATITAGEAFEPGAITAAFGLTSRWSKWIVSLMQQALNDRLSEVGSEPCWPPGRPIFTTEWLTRKIKQLEDG